MKYKKKQIKGSLITVIFSLFFSFQSGENSFANTSRPATQTQISNARVLDLSLMKVDLFGSSYFINNATEVLQMSRNKRVQSDYIVGPKDIFLIKIRGVTNEEFRVEVNNRGVLSFAKIPSINVSGLSLREAREKILEFVLIGYKNVDVEVEIIDLKDIDVIITGNVKKPGAYSIRANNTLLDLLYISGGPTETGSFRNIQLIRQKNHAEESKTEERKTIDLYNLFIKGIHESIVLESGDRIHIPNISNHSTILGEIKTPAQYEWLQDITLNEFVQISGGFTADANIHRIQLFRINGNNNYTYLEIDYSKPENQSKILNDGDIVRIPDNEEILLENNIFVDIDGRVNYPGRYILARNSTLSELIQSAGGLKSDSFLNGVVLEREELIEEQKRIQKRVIQDLESQLLKIQADYTENAILNDDQKLMMKAQSLRQNILQSQGNILYEGRLNFDPSKDDPILQNNDSVYIPAEPNTVSVIGAVYNSGTLLYQKNWGINEYLNHMGGLTPFADVDGIYILKPFGHVINVKNNENTMKIDKGDIIVVPLEIKLLINGSESN